MDSLPELAERERRDLRDDGVAEGAKAVHPIGKPISASTNAGLRTARCDPLGPAFSVVGARREACVFNGREFLFACDGPAVFAESCTVGVAHIFAASVSVVPECLPLSVE